MIRRDSKKDKVPQNGGQVYMYTWLPDSYGSKNKPVTLPQPADSATSRLGAHATAACSFGSMGVLDSSPSRGNKAYIVILVSRRKSYFPQD